MKPEPFAEELSSFARALAWSSSRSVHEREDLMQEIFIVYLELSMKYEGMPAGEFVMVAKQSARNRVRDFYRRKKVRSYVPRPDKEFDYGGTVSVEQADMLDFIAGKLGRDGKTVMRMLRDGLSASDISKITGASYTSVWRRIDEIRRAGSAEAGRAF